MNSQRMLRWGWYALQGVCGIMGANAAMEICLKENLLDKEPLKATGIIMSSTAIGMLPPFGIGFGYIYLSQRKVLDNQPYQAYLNPFYNRRAIHE